MARRLEVSFSVEDCVFLFEEFVSSPDGFLRDIANDAKRFLDYWDLWPTSTKGGE